MRPCSITLYCGNRRQEYATDPAFVWTVAIQLQVRPTSALLQLTQRGGDNAPVIALLHGDSTEPVLVDALQQPLRARPLTTVLAAWNADDARGQLLPPSALVARTYTRFYDAVAPLAENLDVVLCLESNPLRAGVDEE